MPKKNVRATKKQLAILSGRYFDQMKKLGMNVHVILANGHGRDYKYLDGSSLEIGVAVRDLLLDQPSILAGATMAALEAQKQAEAEVASRKTRKAKKTKKA